MNKHTNPFFTFMEVITTLKDLGVDPLKGESAPGTPECNQTYWQDHILSINTYCRYEGTSHYHAYSIHLDNTGFDDVISQLSKHTHEKVQVRQHSVDYEEHYIEIGPMLKLFKLVRLWEDKI